LDFGILIAWGAVNTAFFPICCWFQRKYLFYAYTTGTELSIHLGWKTQRGIHEYWPME
jgi:hypothetical protein